jgi:hypothetical protein
MTEQELRVLVRDAIARHAGQGAANFTSMRAMACSRCRPAPIPMVPALSSPPSSAITADTANPTDTDPLSDLRIYELTDCEIPQ